MKRTVKTDDDGRFNFPQLKPGPYSVKVEADQFEAQENPFRDGGPGAKANGRLHAEDRGLEPDDHGDARERRW